jgi:hypothetical protein
METMNEVARRGTTQVIFEINSKRVVDATQKLQRGVSVPLYVIFKVFCL